jgi:hypothetical protein
MGIFRHYQSFKGIILVCYIMNIVLICVGAVAIHSYLETHDPSNLQLIGVALGVLIFGIILPAVAVNQMIKRIEAARLRTEKIVAEYVSQWIASFKDYEETDPLHNPRFWINMGLLMVEVVGDNSRHPALQAMAEFSPIMRAELRKASRSETSVKKRSSKSED